MTPRDIATAGLEAADAGAAILHIHVRDLETRQNSHELALFQEVVDRVREQNKDVLLNLTTSAGSSFSMETGDPGARHPDTAIWPAAERVRHVLALKPEICTLDLVTAQLGGVIAVSYEPVIVEMAKQIEAAGVLPEIELFDAGDMVFAQRLIDQGTLTEPGLYSLVTGLNYGMPSTPDTMLYMRNRLPVGAVWTGFGIGRGQFPMMAQSVLMGGHARVGMEDNVYLSKGVLTPNNAALVTKAREIIERLGPQVATTREARTLLRIA